MPNQMSSPYTFPTSPAQVQASLPSSTALKTLISGGECMKQPTIEQVAAIAWDLLRDDDDPMFSHSLKDHQESCVYAAETVASSGIGETPYEKQVLRVLHNLEAALADVKARYEAPAPTPAPAPEIEVEAPTKKLATKKKG